jgi:hypothetical protein
VPSDSVSIPAATVAPTTLAPSKTADADTATKPKAPATAERKDGANPAKVVRAAFERLGLGTVAASAGAQNGAPVAAALAQACTPIGTAAATVAPQVGTTLTTRSALRTHRVDEDPPVARGPPAPLQSPLSPIAAAAAAGAATGGVSGEHNAAILANQIVLTLADGGFAVATDCCDYVAPAPANAAARAPPVV